MVTYQYFGHYYLPESSVSITVTNSKLVPLLGEHNFIDLGKYSRLSHSSNLEKEIKMQKQRAELLTCEA